MAGPDFAFDNSYARDLDGFYVPWRAAAVPAPELLVLNEGLARDLGLDPDALRSPPGLAVLSGNAAPDGATPLAQAYAGHQFGGFSPQLGDGRALLLGETVDRAGRRRDIQLKGSGPTPFSRGGDGKAALGPVLREYLIAEAMHVLGIPTTRALAACTTGERIMRDGKKTGAVLARVAASHIRVGTFQFFAARGETDRVRQLADYAIARHYPEIGDRPDRYLEFFRRVRDRQATLVAKWMNVGFVHGVMNTDNTTVSGETIDYGPCAFIDAYDPGAVFSSIDEGGRYAYGNQPVIMRWNLARFAETLIALVNPDDHDDAIRQLTNELNVFPHCYQKAWLAGMRAKLGLKEKREEDADLANDLLGIAHEGRADFTSLFRALSWVVRGERDAFHVLFTDPDATGDWLERYGRRLAHETASPDARASAMDAVNPLYIPRNHLVEAALEAAEAGDMELFDRLSAVLKAPFTKQPDAEAYTRPAPPEFGRYRTYCGT